MLPPLDLSARNDQSTNTTRTTDDGNNSIMKILENTTSQMLLITVDPYVDAHLSGSLEKINFDIGSYTLLEQFLNPSPNDVNAETGVEPVPDLNNDIELTDINATGANVMLKCMVKLDRLSDTTISNWQKQREQSSSFNEDDGLDMPMNQVGPYGLCVCPKVSRNASKLDRRAKRNVNYQIFSGLSQEDDDFDVKPGRWSRPRQRNIFLPAHGPSTSRIAAQEMINKWREEEAATTLLSLGTENSAVTSNNVRPRLLLLCERPHSQQFFYRISVSS